ncbi:hypothetical protein QW71_14295 [Paenibacillus sp. IHB B 3415]|nr:hypothetical protein QW71_14295 [Paenibacillus sp. IHB B 3415]
MAELGRKFVLQGGTQYNLAAVKTQVDYIKRRVPDAEAWVHPHSGEAGAIGTAMETLRTVNRRGYSTFLGLNATIDLRYISRNEESTRCQFCPNRGPDRRSDPDKTRLVWASRKAETAQNASV